MTTRIASVALVSLIACGVSGGATREPVPPPHHVDDPLRVRMRQHAGEMAELRVSRITSSYGRIAAAAREIATQPLIAAAPDDGEVAWLPRQFFALQARMILTAGRVAGAADARDDVALADAFDALTATCRSCHALYRSLEVSR